MQKLIYLASPYSHDDPNVIEHRVCQVQNATAALIEQGNLIFSPIVYTHPIAEMTSFAPVNTAEAMSGWMDYDKAMIDKCDELWVLELDGWAQSRGVEAERNHALATGKTVRHIEYPSLREIGHVKHVSLGFKSLKDMSEFIKENDRVIQKLSQFVGAGTFYSPASSGKPAVLPTDIERYENPCPSEFEQPHGCTPDCHGLTAQDEEPAPKRDVSLPDDAETRNGYPMADGLLYYFPNALAEVSKISRIGNEQHNPGEDMHWSRGKSTDHANKIIRHLIDAGRTDDKGNRHSALVAWRALALLQEELEAAYDLPLPKNARYDDE